MMPVSIKVVSFRVSVVDSHTSRVRTTMIDDGSTKPALWYHPLLLYACPSAKIVRYSSTVRVCSSQSHLETNTIVEEGGQ